MQNKKLRALDDVAVFVRSLHPDIKRKIKSGLKLILENPNAGKALKSDLSGLYSLRIGRFRIIYKFLENEITLITIGPRKTIYQETARLIQKQQGKDI
jgi:mRNA interferase RelE/StbE